MTLVRVRLELLMSFRLYFLTLTIKNHFLCLKLRIIASNSHVQGLRLVKYRTVRRQTAKAYGTVIREDCQAFCTLELASLES